MGSPMLPLVQVTALPLLLLALALLGPAVAKEGSAPAWQVVGAEDLELLDVDGVTYARTQHTIIGGEVLVAGADNLQDSFNSCAASCTAHPRCNGFNFCPPGRPCPADEGKETVPPLSCQLVFQMSAEDGRGVVEEASGNPQMGDAGLKVHISHPDPDAFPGYEVFMAQSMFYYRDFACNGSVTPGDCVLVAPLADIVARCNSLAICQGIVVGEKWGNYSIPYGMLKGNSSKGEPLDPKKGNLNPTAYTLIKQSALPTTDGSTAAASDGGGGGLSAGAVAGIVIGAVVAVAVVAAAATAAILRRHRPLTLGDAEKGLGKKQGSVGMMAWESGIGNFSRGTNRSDEVPATWGRKQADAGSEATLSLLEELQAHMPGPQWQDLYVHRHQVQFCTKDGRPVRLGGGASGTVYRGLLNNATPCALKVFDFEENASLKRHFIQEAAMLRRLVHPNIVQLIGVSMTERWGVLILELVGGGDLWKAMRMDTGRAGQGRTFSWYNRNMLLARDGTVKIGDVGFSKMLHSSHMTLESGRIGTFNWAAPEVLLGGRASFAADIYSLGIILWELCTGEEPVRGLLSSLQAPEHCPPEVAELQARCVRQNPEERPSAEEVVQALKAAVLAAVGARGAAAGVAAPLSDSLVLPNRRPW